MKERPITIRNAKETIIGRGNFSMGERYSTETHSSKVHWSIFISLLFLHPIRFSSSAPSLFTLLLSGFDSWVASSSSSSASSLTALSAAFLALLDLSWARHDHNI
jgi:hypothetical protein